MRNSNFMRILSFGVQCISNCNASDFTWIKRNNNNTPTEKDHFEMQAKITDNLKTIYVFLMIQIWLIAQPNWSVYVSCFIFVVLVLISIIKWRCLYHTSQVQINSYWNKNTRMLIKLLSSVCKKKTKQKPTHVTRFLAKSIFFLLRVKQAI